MGTQKPGGGGGGGGGSSAIRAGRAFFELFAKDNISKVLDRISAKVKAFGAGMSKVGAAGLGAGALLGAGPLGLLLGGGSRLAEIAQLSRQLQVPIELMGRFQHAAERAGVSVEEVMNDTRGRFSDLLNQAPLVDPDEARSALQIQNDFKDSIRALQDALTPLLKEIAPVVREVAAFVRENAELVKILAAVAAVLGGVGLAFSVAGPLVTAAGAAIGGVVTVVGMLLTPLGLVAAALTGAGAAFLAFSDAGKKAAGDIGEAFKGIGDTFKTTWGGLVDAVKAGDLELAFQVVGAGVKAVWAQVMLSLRKGWNDFMAWTVDALRKNPWILPLIGGAVGGFAGGPMGAAAGALAGLTASAGIEVFADEIKNALTFNTDDAAKRLKDAKAELMGLRVRAGEAAAQVEERRPGYKKVEDAAKAVNEVRGGFSVASAQSQFGFGAKASEMTELMRQQLAAEQKQAAIGQQLLDEEKAQQKRWEQLMEEFRMK